MTIEAVIDLIEMGAVAPQDIVKCLRSALRDTPQRAWVGLMRGVRVEGETVVISVKGGNEAARELCGELVREMESQRQILLEDFPNLMEKP